MARVQFTVSYYGPYLYDDTNYPYGYDGIDCVLRYKNAVVNDLSANLLVASDADKKLASVSNLANWVAGTANEIDVTDDGDGTITLSLASTSIIRRAYTISHGTSDSDLASQLGCGIRTMFHVYTEEGSPEYVIGFIQFNSTGTPLIQAIANSANADTAIGNPPSGTAGKLTVGVRNAVNDYFYIFNSLGSQKTFQVVLW